MKLKDFKEESLPLCNWEGCNNPGKAMINSPGKGYIPFCFEHYKIVRLKMKEVQIPLKEDKK